MVNAAMVELDSIFAGGIPVVDCLQDEKEINYIFSRSRIRVIFPASISISAGRGLEL